MRLVRATLPTPVGPMLALASDGALCALEFGTASRQLRLEARLLRFFATSRVEDGANDVIERTRDWLEAYFAGAAADASSLPLGAMGTRFEQKVWKALRTIPAGETRSYGQVAAQVASTVNASRAVGLANGANPIAIVVPCHRVIGADGSLIGYGGGLDRKLWLLEHEQRFWPTDTSLSRVAPHHRAPRDSRQPRFEF
ncbi:MAG TPA: methylated-DNA--[protein]-cysteine S-methyltransferase [Vicinamibacterales bacterium]|nr:methylated-DNA--[protein]-cysteine S-methyltransferase [Vicinamibacterales bacterium]